MPLLEPTPESVPEPTPDLCTRCGVVLGEERVSTFRNSYCPQCAISYLRSCLDCTEYFGRDEDGATGRSCPSCATNYFTCANCGDRLHMDDYGEDGWCARCWEESNEESDEDVLPCYHEGCTRLIFLPNDLSSLYFGVELETDNYSQRAEACEELERLSQDRSLFWYENDGSLSHGIEIISQPATLEYHLACFPWEQIVAIVRQQGGSSHNTSTCGMHIHLSRNFFAGAGRTLGCLKLVYLFEKFWDEICTFSRRADNEDAQKHRTRVFDGTPHRTKLQHLREAYRYRCVNLVPKDTLEIRTFRGTLRVETILASIEFVDFLARLAKRASVKVLQALTWAELIQDIERKKYKYLISYMEKVGLTRRENHVPNSSETVGD